MMPLFGFQNVVGDSPALRDAVARASRVAEARRTPVLLVGEAGTGKELFARGIHYASAAANEPFVAINCAAVPDALLEAELFGYDGSSEPRGRAAKQGLFELAAAGTLFLDEAHRLSPTMQPKLLRALETRRVRRIGSAREMDVECRVIAAASPHLEQAVRSGEFREDLFERLGVFTILLPPLRERPEDIVPTSRYFLEEVAHNEGASKPLSTDAEAALQIHRWPGNVRELRTVIERAAILSAESDEVRAEHLLIQRRTVAPSGEEVAGMICIPTIGRLLSDIEREAVQVTLKITSGNRTAAARLLGISRPTLAKKLDGVT